MRWQRCADALGVVKPQVVGSCSEGTRRPAHAPPVEALPPPESDSPVIGLTTAWPSPPQQTRPPALAPLRAGKRASYAELSTDLGHDSFLLESEELYSLVRAFLERGQHYDSNYSI